MKVPRLFAAAGQLRDQTVKYRPGLERAIVIALLIGQRNPKRGLNDKISPWTRAHARESRLIRTGRLINTRASE